MFSSKFVKFYETLIFSKKITVEWSFRHVVRCYDEPKEIFFPKLSNFFIRSSKKRVKLSGKYFLLTKFFWTGRRQFGSFAGNVLTKCGVFESFPKTIFEYHNIENLVWLTMPCCTRTILFDNTAAKLSLKTESFLLFLWKKSWNYKSFNKKNICSHNNLPDINITFCWLFRIFFAKSRNLFSQVAKWLLIRVFPGKIPSLQKFL